MKVWHNDGKYILQCLQWFSMFTFHFQSSNGQKNSEKTKILRKYLLRAIDQVLFVFAFFFFSPYLLWIWTISGFFMWLTKVAISPGHLFWTLQHHSHTMLGTTLFWTVPRSIFWWVQWFVSTLYLRPLLQRSLSTVTFSCPHTIFSIYPFINI